MNVAYLILAHNMPAHLQRMINALYSENSSFFIHVDLKADINYFRCLDELNVNFIEERVNVNRFGFSMSQAMINLMKQAHSTNNFDYYIFLSGQDYPIKTNVQIQNFLSKYEGMSFINFYPLLNGADMAHWVTKHYFIDYYAGFPKVVIKLFKIFEKYINKFLPDRTMPLGYVPYRGSQWSGLHKEAFEYILDFIDSPQGNEIIKYFKSVKCPDETLFQTILLNSSFANTCRYYGRDILENKDLMKNENKAYLHYIDWDADREDPAILDETDFGKISKSEFLFARKFNEVKSGRLLEMIDSQLLKF